MVLYHIIILALVQGITEFLPISSSGHLVLGHAFMHGDITDIAWRREDVVLDVAVHLGTLFSVLVYFRKDIANMLGGSIKALAQGERTTDGKLAFHVLIASIPVIVAGLLLNIMSPDWVRSVAVVAWTTLIFGVLLWVADSFFSQHRQLEDMGWRGALIIGFAQVLALIPGTSRSGITMTAARFCGFNRVDSARFSMLLAIIAIAGAGFLSILDVIDAGDFALGLDALLALIIAFFSGWVAIAIMMKWLEKSSFLPFVIYRIALGGGLLLFIYL